MPWFTSKKSLFVPNWVRESWGRWSRVPGGDQICIADAYQVEQRPHLECKDIGTSYVGGLMLERSTFRIIIYLVRNAALSWTLLIFRS